jgi:dihydrofolate synthase / folylpolyglutamate synthase
MIVKPYKTHKVKPGDDLHNILDKYLPRVNENSIIAIASKIVGICEGRVVKIESADQKDELVKQEADYYLPREYNQYGFMITINKGILVASAGIDESNSGEYFSLWPEDPQKSANEIREYLIKKCNLTNLGVIITDSKLTPLRWGVTGVALAHSGFQSLNSYIGQPDIFGRLMHAEKSNVADSLATAAVAEMGEGNEQQPLAVITEANFVQFQPRNPTQEELNNLKISLEDDVYASLLTAMEWKKGRNNSKRKTN